MYQTQSDLVTTLKQIVEKRIINKEPSVGSYSWICIFKTIPLEKGQSYYKIGKTSRLETYLARQKRESTYSTGTPQLVLKAWGGAEYLVKVIRRIFKDKRVSSSISDGLFKLREEDLAWLSKFKLVNTAYLNSEVYKLFDEENPSFLGILRKEGLF